MLGLEKLEIALANKSTLQNLQTEDRTLLNHMESARSITIQLDKTNLGLAYHVHCMKPCLEGNTLGFPTDFVKFAEQKLGIKKAQAYNLDTIGEHVVKVLDTEIYLDKWTYTNLVEDCTTDNKTDWEMLKKLARTRKTLVSTKVLTVCRLLGKYDMSDDDVRAFIADKNNHAYTATVKEFEKLLTEPFNALPDKKKVDSKATETNETNETNETTENTETTETAKTTESKRKVVEIDYFTMCIILTRLVFTASEDDKFVPQLLSELNQDTDFWKEYEDYADRLTK